MTKPILSAAVLLQLFGAGCSSLKTQAARPGADRKAMAEFVVKNWSGVSALAARRLIERYGAPDDIGPDYLIWRGKGPWKRTVVQDVTPPYIVTGDVGVLEQTIDYPLTQEQAAALDSLSCRFIVNHERGELTVRSDQEETDYLCLNLGDEVARGRKTVEQARAEHASILDLKTSGKSSPYTAGLVFSFGR